MGDKYLERAERGLARARKRLDKAERKFNQECAYCFVEELFNHYGRYEGSPSEQLSFDAWLTQRGVNIHAGKLAELLDRFCCDRCEAARLVNSRLRELGYKARFNTVMLFATLPNKVAT